MLSKFPVNSQSASLTPDTETNAHFRPLVIIVPVLLLLVLTGWWSKWYAQSIYIPRYCENPAVTMQLLESVIIEVRPAGEESRIPYLIAAKLLFLIPRRSEESVSQYLERIELFLKDNCH